MDLNYEETWQEKVDGYVSRLSEAADECFRTGDFAKHDPINKQIWGEIRAEGLVSEVSTALAFNALSEMAECP